MDFKYRWAAPLAAAVALSACAHRAPPVQHAPVSGPSHALPYAQVEYGRIAHIETVSARNATSGGGALIGAVVGAVVGRQFGSSGSGRATGTVLGAFGGAVIGNEIEKDQRGRRDAVRVTIQLDRGGVVAYDYAQIGDIRVGDRVRVEGSQVYRL